MNREKSHGEGFIITCCDDLCQDGCIHGDGEITCNVCHGYGEVPDFEEEDLSEEREP